ncbi:MAG: TlpA family protein disulfide reductase [Actinobacteria bacterium]|nr:TlpA family protein disulfide reductase [Actinomycetota bacterium]
MTEKGLAPTSSAGHQPRPQRAGQELVTEGALVPGRRRRWWMWVLVAVVGAVVAVVSFAFQPEAADELALTVTLDGPAPPFDLENVRPGQPRVSLADVADRPTVVNVWASWCTPCRREMPALAAAHRQFGDRVAFLGVNHQDTRDLAIELLDETGVAYPSGYDPDGSVARDYGLFGMPTTIFIAGDGELLERRTGELTLPEMESTITRLFLGAEAR